MWGTLAGLIHEAASVDDFVRSVVQFCNEHGSSQTYLHSSNRFFEYVRELGASVCLFIEELVIEAEYSTEFLKEYRQKLILIKKCWSLLHAFIKPAVDAHTLRIPVPLIDFLELQLSNMENLKGTTIVLLLTSELNYFHHRHSQLKLVANSLRLIIPEAPQFPEKIGFLAIPYSQSSRAFSNVLMYHELGHFVSEEFSKDQKVASLVHEELSPIIAHALTAVFGERYLKVDKATKTYCQRRLGRWCEEIFCDLFAIRLVGPAFTLASIELFNLMGLLDDSQAVEFSSHPAYACRFREHLRLLKRLGWWSEIYRTKAEQMGLIAHLAALPESRYKLAPETDLRQEFITAFLTIRLHIRRVVDKVCLGVPSGISGFRQYRLHIKEYLSHGVVPSSLSIKERMHHPDPVAVLNAAFCYYLEGLPRFIVPRTTTERRSELNRRVDMWAAKAVDDYKLLRAVRES